MGGESIAARSEAANQALPKIFLSRIERAVRRAQAAMLGMQHPDGYWWAELESNVTITAEYIMLHRFLGLDESQVPRMAADILHRQLANGGWSIWHGDGGELSTSVEAYFALKIAGLAPDDPRMVKAREFILARGGALKTRVFTRIFLALFGQISWEGIPLLPVEFILLPPWSGFSIYEFSSWSRETIVPLMIIMAKRPVRPLPPDQWVTELFLDPSEPFRTTPGGLEAQRPTPGKLLRRGRPHPEALLPAAPPLAAEPGHQEGGELGPGTPGRERRLGRYPARHGQFACWPCPSWDMPMTMR